MAEEGKNNRTIGDAIHEIWNDIGCFVFVIMFALMCMTCHKCNQVVNNDKTENH